MTDQQQAPAPQGDIAAPDRHEAQAALLDALMMCAKKAAGEDRAAEVKDYGAAALAFAQAIITLDPQRLAGGDTPQARKASQPDPQLPSTKDGDRDGRLNE